MSISMRGVPDSSSLQSWPRASINSDSVQQSEASVTAPHEGHRIAKTASGYLEEGGLNCRTPPSVRNRDASYQE